MNISDRLYVEIVPFEGDRAPQPHPVRDGHFDPAFVYKVLGMYNPSETGESYFILSNTDRQIWFISNRHLRAFGLFDGDALFFDREHAPKPSRENGHALRSHGKSRLAADA